MADSISSILVAIGMVYLLSSIINPIFRKLRLFDFIGYLTVGAVLGVLFSIKTDIPQVAELLDVEGNPIWTLLVLFGLLTYVLNLTFNFEPSVFQLNLKSETTFGLIYLAINFILLGVIPFLLFLDYKIWPAVALVFCFLPINIGPMITRIFPENRVPTQSQLFLLKLAIGIDLITLFVFAIVHSVSLVIQQAVHWLNLIYLILYFLLSVLLLAVGLFARRTKRAEKIGTGFLISFSLGFIFVTTYLGLQLGFSPILVAIWLGLVLKSFLSSFPQFEMGGINQLIQIVIIFPFVEIGRLLVSEFRVDVPTTLSFVFFLISIFLIAVTVGILLFQKLNISFANSISLFIKGELTILLLWLVYSEGTIPAILFFSGIGVVVISSIVGRYLYLFFLKPRIQD